MTESSPEEALLAAVREMGRARRALLAALRRMGVETPGRRPDGALAADREAVLEFLRGRGPTRPAEVVEFTGLRRALADTALAGLVRQGRAVRLGEGVYGVRDEEVGDGSAELGDGGGRGGAALGLLRGDDGGRLGEAGLSEEDEDGLGGVRPGVRAGGGDLGLRVGEAAVGPDPAAIEQANRIRRAAVDGMVAAAQERIRRSEGGAPGGQEAPDPPVYVPGLPEPSRPARREGWGWGDGYERVEDEDG